MIYKYCSSVLYNSLSWYPTYLPTYLPTYFTVGTQVLTVLKVLNRLRYCTYISTSNIQHPLLLPPLLLPSPRRLSPSLSLSLPRTHILTGYRQKHSAGLFYPTLFLYCFIASLSTALLRCYNPAPGLHIRGRLEIWEGGGGGGGREEERR